MDQNVILVETVPLEFDLESLGCRLRIRPGKDAQYVRVGLQQGILKFGYAMKLDKSSEYNYYCPDKKVWEETGYFRDKEAS